MTSTSHFHFIGSEQGLDDHHVHQVFHRPAYSQHEGHGKWQKRRLQRSNLPVHRRAVFAEADRWELGTYTTADY